MYLFVSCHAFVGNYDLIHRLLGGFWLSPKGSIQEAEQWPKLKELVDGARDLSVVIEVNKALHQPEPLR